jgi:glycosyltransferase involved in cell wall biosynthesis
VGGIGEGGLVKISDIKLTLFFTGGVGLNTWAEVGNLDREIAIYKRLAEHLDAVNFVTYGGERDKQYSDRIGKIRAYPIAWSRSTSINILRLLIRHRKMINQNDVLKTNQIQGSEIPIWLKKRFGKKLIVRCGYLFSRFAELSNNRVADSAYAHKLERYAFENADLGVVTTELNRRYVTEKYGIEPDKLVVIPNYVDTDNFRPGGYKKEYDIVFVGRGEKQKNLGSLFEAATVLRRKGHDLRILLIGGCSSDKDLKEMTKRNDMDVTFKENVGNELLPDLLNRAKIFILPSMYEGHPKVLLEAMSCALPCIGTEVEGIKELIDHRETGYLCKTDPRSIADAIDTVLSDEVLRRKMGEKARRHIVENFSLERVLKMELDVINEATGR